MNNGKFILDDDHVAIPCDDVLEWAGWIERTDRSVAQHVIGPARISTVFLGLDHSFGIGEPKLFETAVFGGLLDGERIRTATWQEAERMHDIVCERVFMTRPGMFESWGAFARSAIARILIAALIVALAIVATSQASAQTCSALLSWQAPTQNTDGTPVTNLAGFKLYFGQSSGNLSQSVTIANPAALTYRVENLTAATWFFAATAYNAAGAESAFSNIASKTTIGCVPLPDPRPPAGVTITTQAITVFDYVPQVDDTLMLPIGTVPEGTQCLAAQGVIADGVVYFAVPRAAVSFAGNVQPDIVYARCG